MPGEGAGRQVWDENNGISQLLSSKVQPSDKTVTPMFSASSPRWGLRLRGIKQHTLDYAARVQGADSNPGTMSTGPLTCAPHYSPPQQPHTLMSKAPSLYWTACKFPLSRIPFLSSSRAKKADLDFSAHSCHPATHPHPVAHSSPRQKWIKMIF